MEFGAVRATLTGAIWQMFGTAFALWIPCLPIFFLMRNALNSKAGNKCASDPLIPHAPKQSGHITVQSWSILGSCLV